MYWVCDRIRHSSARRVTVPQAAARFEEPRKHGTVLVVTFRENGAPVATPLSCVLEHGRLLASTAPDSGKVKRIRRNSRVLVTPSSVRGSPVGPTVDAVARILDSADARRAERVLDGRYGRIRRLYRRLIGVSPNETAYLEFTPAEADPFAADHSGS